MKLTPNNIRPESLRSLETDFGSSTSRYIYRKIAAAILFNNESYPIGFIKFFYQQQLQTDGQLIAPPNPEQWIFCNGDIINDEQSVLHGLATPDLRGLFPKHGEQGNTGGQSSVNLTHNHGGYTHTTSDSGHHNADGGSGAHGGSYHKHSMPNSMTSAENSIPPYLEVQPYMRYK